MMKRTLVSLCAVAICAGTLSAYPTIEFLPPGFLLTDLSTGASVGTGNIQGDGSFETFRWTPSDGVQPLGRGSISAIGVGGGSPDISHDGQRISASILSTDFKLTLGLWDPTNGMDRSISSHGRRWRPSGSVICLRMGTLG